MENVKWLLLRIRAYIFLIFAALVGSLLESGGTTGISLLIKSLVDNVFILKNYGELFGTVSFLLLFAIVNQLGNFLVSMVTNLYSEKEAKKMRNEVFEKILFAPYSSLLKSSSGDFTARLLSDVQAYRNLLGDHVPKLFRDPITVVALLGVLFYRDWFLTLLLGVLVPILALMVKYFGSKKGKHSKRLQENLGHITQNLSNVLYGYENIRMFMAERMFFDWFKEINSRILKAGMKSALYSTTNTVFNFLFGYAVVALIILYGGVRVLQGSLTPGDFISYLTALFLIQQPLSEVQKGMMEVRASMPIIGRIRELLNLPREKEDGLPFEGLKEGIKVVNLSVAFGDNVVLQDINIHVRRGEKVGIVGHTGSGKTTFLKVLAGLLDYDGSVKYDDLELKRIEKRSLRDSIAFFTQRPFLFEGSIRKNMIIAKEEATDEEIHRALNLAMCNFVTNLDQEIEEMGKNLSGGEVQRLALARLFLKDPQIVILDEVTSAMDVKTEEEILKNIFEFFGDRTILISAHRFSNILLCDRALVFNNGVLTAEGHPEEVIKAFLQSP
ncbi:MAG: ABC transporter ATP-binding protein [Aquificaceae bacterium]